MKKRILWVDDEISAFSAHMRYLEKEGYSVTTETNGDDAIDTFTHQAVDLVLLDQNMPGMSGLDTLAEIKRLKPNVPVVMVTKNEDQDTIKSAFGKYSKVRNRRNMTGADAAYQLLMISSARQSSWLSRRRASSSRP